MKKILFVMLLSMVLLAGVAAESADYLTFTVGAGFASDITGTNDDIMANNVFGVDYNFNNGYTGGFKYINMGSGAATFSVVNFTMSPKENVYVSLYTGSASTTGALASTDAAFGLGLSYDFFTKKDGIFSAMGVYIDWMASSTSNKNVAAIADGGALAMGLKTKVGF